MSKNLILVFALVAGAVVYPFQSFGSESFAGFPTLAVKKEYIRDVRDGRNPIHVNSPDPEARAMAVRMLHAFIKLTPQEFSRYAPRFEQTPLELALQAAQDQDDRVIEQFAYLAHNWGYPILIPSLLALAKTDHLPSQLKRVLIRALQPYNRYAVVLDFLEDLIRNSSTETDYWVLSAAAFALRAGDEERSLDLVEFILGGGNQKLGLDVGIQALRGRIGERSRELMIRYSKHPAHGPVLEKELEEHFSCKALVGI